MKPQTTDFNRVEPHQVQIHERLRNWSRWVSVRPHSRVHPMFKFFKPKPQYEAKEYRESCDLLDAQAIEKVVGGLPPDHAFALRWHYVYSFPVGEARRMVGTNSDGLYRYLRDGRQMVINLVD